jgi:hypothetical protein
MNYSPHHRDTEITEVLNLLLCLEIPAKLYHLPLRDIVLKIILFLRLSSFVQSSSPDWTKQKSALCSLCLCGENT